MSRGELKLRLGTALFFILTLVSANCFAAVDGLTISDKFPLDGLMLENHVYKNAAVFENIGVYSGAIYATPIYENAPIYCDPGYYVPEDSTECSICDKNHYCVGGENAVKEACPDGLVSPVGTMTAGGCGKIMHVGEDILYTTTEKQTSPAFAVMFGDKVYYAKMTPVSDGVKTINKDTTHTLHAIYNEIEYYVYDNTVE